jgi:hypothetical protein
VAAAARVHRRDELKPGRIDDAVVGPCDRDFAGFERLAQAVQNLRLAFRQFVEKQNAMMGQRDFAWPRPCSTADKCRHRGRMMRCAEGPSIGERAAREIPRDGMDQRNLEEFTRYERRQNRRQAARIDFPAPGGPFNKRLWPPAAAISRARLALSWPLMSRRSGCAPTCPRTAGRGLAMTCVPLK